MSTVVTQLNILLSDEVCRANRRLDQICQYYNESTIAMSKAKCGLRKYREKIIDIYKLMGMLLVKIPTTPEYSGILESAFEKIEKLKQQIQLCDKHLMKHNKDMKEIKIDEQFPMLEYEKIDTIVSDWMNTIEVHFSPTSKLMKGSCPHCYHIQRN